MVYRSPLFRLALQNSDLDFGLPNEPDRALTQVFVHTMLAKNVTLKRDDVSWVTQLTADRLDIFSQVLKRLSKENLCI